MGTSQDGPALAHHPAPSPSPSSPSPSDCSTLGDEQDVLEHLSEHESKILDHSISFLDQEYEYQRHLINHYSHRRDELANPAYPPKQTTNISDNQTCHQPQHLRLPGTYGKRRGDPYAPPRINTGMDDGALREKGYAASTHSAYAYYYPQRRRPLIDLVSNQWRTAASSPSSPTAPSFSQLVSAPKFRRYLLIILLVFILPWFSWTRYGRPRWEERRLLNNALDESLRAGSVWYGLNMRPAFLDMTQLQTLESNQLPRSARERRLIFIGNVHGCQDELKALLAESNYSNLKDHVVFTGGLISRGPASSSVVDFAMDSGASCVRGNAEDRILLAHRDLNNHRIALPGPDEGQRHLDSTHPRPGNPITDNLDEESFSHGDYVDRKFARSLSSEQASYLASCPVILDVGHLPGMGRTTAVHAGLVAGIELENQDPMGVMNMRTVDLKTHVPSREPNGTPWFKLWNKYQESLPANARSTVIYAHDSIRGLQINPYTKGIDTGCVKGGKLTALVVTLADNQQAKQEIVSVQCKDYRKMKEKGSGWDDAPFLAIKDDEHGGRGSGHFRR
ncbi:MAG: hypothetical protein LQ352_002133 [Teloschistes flavicans]|nr:MAG: hypothetical protein LQ352_002133 [Teloschistes flavicans]